MSIKDQISVKDENEVGVGTTHYEEEASENVQLPRGWLYHQPRVGSWRLPHYASPIVQLVYVALIFFL
jgi:hypothetical protein